MGSSLRSLTSSAWTDRLNGLVQAEIRTEERNTQMKYTKPEVLTPTAATSTIQGGVEKAGGMIQDAPDLRTNNPAYEDE